MQRTIVLLLWGWALAFGGEPLPDSDGDGVPDDFDQCCATPAGLEIDRYGRPIGDEDEDCDVDLHDINVLIDNLSGPTEYVGPCRWQCRSSEDCLCDEFCARPPGECDGVGHCAPRPLVCPQQFLPACGCDGKSYDHPCLAFSAGTSLLTQGDRCHCTSNADCRSREFCGKGIGDCTGRGECYPILVECPDERSPVCGCDGRTYPSLCLAVAAGVNVDTEQRCETDRCQLPPETGPCAAALPRYFHDPESRRCLLFVYGGCGGNANNFVTIEECQEVCAPIPTCKLPKDPGPCRAAIPRYWFNHQTGSCEVFLYGGCGGNDNNFETPSECEQACPPIQTCDLPFVGGPCDAYIPRWAFNPRTGQCERFIYGGCGGNQNNFESKEMCEEACVPRDLCNLPIESGDCRAVILRFAYNPATRDCEPFVYGGCGGNANNFTTLQECKKACEP